MKNRGPGKIHEVPLEAFMQSDPDDSDFDATATNTRSAKKPKPKKLKSKSKSSSSRNKPSRRRDRYNSDEVVSDSLGSASEESFDDDVGADEEPVELSKSGRPTRRAVRNTSANYAESEVASDEFAEEESEQENQESDDELAISPKKPKKQAELVVTLHLSPKMLRGVENPGKGGRNLRRTTRSVSATARQVSEGPVRRSSRRLSADPDEGTLELDNAGRPRYTASKAPAKTVAKKTTNQPSIIMEESQETGPSKEVDEMEIDGEPDDDHNVLVESIEHQAEQGSQHEQSANEEDEGDDEDEDDMPVRRNTRLQAKRPSNKSTPAVSQSNSQKRKRSGSEDEYDPEDATSQVAAASGDEIEQPKSKKARTPDSDEEMSVDDDDDIDAEEVAEELDELDLPRRNRRKRPRLTTNLTDGIIYDQPARSLRKRESQRAINYNLLPTTVIEEDANDDQDRPDRPLSRNTARSNAYRGLFNLAGPFGGNIGTGRLPFGPDAQSNAALLGDDSSDDDEQAPLTAILPGMTPRTPQVAQTHNLDGGGLKNLGRVSKKDMADVTPLGTSDVGFDKVGGLDDHIDKLKEMVMLPLMYPEMYEKWKIAPPRGVLFHGPPGTGKTLLARALASSVSTEEKKVTFYMRKGADVMSKWVGEAERQLRLLFDEAKKNQPAIIFFDEFDGLAPVRSSKQEQIHASIVTTLLALMDGMDVRGQIVVIGATNRPDSIDPAFRRPGRFDREFYFPLPNKDARRAIIDIHTRGWEPAMEDNFKNDLADLTKGYGGSDLRALCTEAVINAVQRTYPQIYRSDKKLEVDSSSVRVKPKDFLLSIRKIVPSSARQSGALAEALPKRIAPLLQDQLDSICQKLDETIPQKRKQLTALEEAEYDDPDDPAGFEHEEILRAFDNGRIFRPRLLIRGVRGMGQKYLSSAVLHKLENFFVRSLDLSSLYGDPANSPEAIISSAFRECRSHQPSVIFIPQINTWYQTVSENVVQTFSTLIRSLAANDAVLLLGVIETDSANDEVNPMMLKDLFGFSTKHEYRIREPRESSRLQFFEPLMSYARKRPSEFPEQEDRKKRKLPDLPLAKEAPKVQVVPTKEELKAQHKADRSTINMLRLVLTPTMLSIKKDHRVFRLSVIGDRDLEYLYKEQLPEYLSSDLTTEQRELQQQLRPYEISMDKHGNPGLRETASGKFFYNCNIQIVEQRLSNGYYKRPKDFLWDLKTIVKDAKENGIPDNLIKANNMLGFARAEIELVEAGNPVLFANCEAVFRREQERANLAKAKNAVNPLNIHPSAPPSTVPTGPIVLGELIQDRPELPMPKTPNQNRDRPEVAHTNGDTVPSNINGSYEPGISEAISSGTRPQFPGGYTVTPSNPTTQDQASVKNAPGTHAGDKRTSNSTTTNESPHTSTGTDYAVHPFTQSTGGGTQNEVYTLNRSQREWERMYPPALSGDSQLPDTYPNSINTNISHTNAHNDPEANDTGAGGFPKPKMSAREMQQQTGLMTAPPTSQPVPAGSDGATQRPIVVPNPPTPPPPFILDEDQLLRLHKFMGDKTAGLTVEQLEMVDARCMDVVWRRRGTWNRELMLKELEEAVKEVLDDVQWQKALPTGMELD